MQLLKNAVGRKLIMSVTGFFLVAFVVVHLMGNLTIYAGPNGINAYARSLHRLTPLLWVFRLFMFSMFVLHTFYGIQLTLENRAASRKGYAIKNSRQTNFAARNMIWTGLLIGVFIIYHLLHFTFQVTNPGISAGTHPDALGRPDVFTMVVLSFRHIMISAGYICAMFILGLHFFHAVQSSFQTVGLNSERTFPVIVKGSVVTAVIIFVGYTLFPVTILTGVLK
jgi:succinate dehydrogenase / fumarate reductase cytochrome b subunit